MTLEEKKAELKRLELEAKKEELAALETEILPKSQPNVFERGLETGGKALGAGAKILDVARGAITAPIAARLLKAATGKEVMSSEEWLNAVNPTNLKIAPSMSQMYERAGVPEGAKLSDYITYAPEGSPWYEGAQKGGMLDPTLRGTGGFASDIAIDPLTYLSLGASAVGKAALEKGAARTAMREAAKESANPLSRVLTGAGEAAGRGYDVLAMPAMKAAEAVHSVPYAGRALDVAARWPSKALDVLGTGMYGSTIQPIEQWGKKYGKMETGKTLYDVGAKWGVDITKKTQKAVDAMEAMRGKIFASAKEAGGKLNLEETFSPVVKEIEALRAEGRPEGLRLADSLEAEVMDHMKMVQGKAAVPETTKVTESLVYPFTKKEIIPGSPAIPGKEVSPALGSTLKTDMWDRVQQAQWDPTKKSAISAEIAKPIGAALQEGTLQSVEKSLGPKAAATVQELNDEMGKLLSTRQGQRVVEAQAARRLHGAVAPTGSGTFAAMLTKDPKMLIIDALRNAGHLGTMPLGYGMKATAESKLLGPMLDSYLRRKYIEQLGEQPGMAE